MSHKTCWLIAVAFFLLPSRDSRAQDPTSRLIPFSLSTSLPPGTTQEVVVELWNAASDGELVIDEPYLGPDALAVDGDGNINFLFGRLQVPPGLLPEYSPSWRAWFAATISRHEPRRDAEVSPSANPDRRTE